MCDVAGAQSAILETELYIICHYALQRVEKQPLAVRTRSFIIT